jgi:hypothetical protein
LAGPCFPSGQDLSIDLTILKGTGKKAKDPAATAAISTLQILTNTKSKFWKKGNPLQAPLATLDLGLTF